MTEIAIIFLIVAALLVYAPRILFAAVGLLALCGGLLVIFLWHAEHAQLDARTRHVDCEAKIAEPVPYKNGRPDYQAEFAAALSEECSRWAR